MLGVGRKPPDVFGVYSSWLTDLSALEFRLLNDEDRGLNALKVKFSKTLRAPCWPLPCFR